MQTCCALLCPCNASGISSTSWKSTSAKRDLNTQDTLKLQREACLKAPPPDPTDFCTLPAATPPDRAHHHPTVDNNFTTEGAALFEIGEALPPDARGLLLRVSLLGASDPARAGELCGAFSGGAPQASVDHLCRTRLQLCQAVYAPRCARHVDVSCTRSPEHLVEPWSGRRPRRHPAAARVAATGATQPAMTEASLQQKVKELRSRLARNRGDMESFLDNAAASRQRARRKRRSRSKCRRRRHRSSSSTSESTESDKGNCLFSPRLASDVTLRDQGRSPHRANAIGAVSRQVGVREGAAMDDSSNASPTRMVSHLASIFFGQRPPEELGLRTTQELKTPAEGLDALL